MDSGPFSFVTTVVGVGAFVGLAWLGNNALGSTHLDLNRLALEFAAICH